jgi:adenine deaminase
MDLPFSKRESKQDSDFAQDGVRTSTMADDNPTPHGFVVFTISHSLPTMATEQSLSSTCSPAMSLLSYEITLFNCKVVHVETGTVLPQHQCVVIDHQGRIAHIVPDNDKNEDEDENNTMSRHRWIATSRTSFDCQGGYLIPGFIDCHVHVTGTWV